MAVETINKTWAVLLTTDVCGIKLREWELFDDREDASQFAGHIADYGKLVEVVGEWHIFPTSVTVYANNQTIEDMREQWGGTYEL